MVCFIFLLLCIDNGLILFRLNKDDKIYIKEELMVKIGRLFLDLLRWCNGCLNFNLFVVRKFIEVEII